ncbi:MAG: hypothetical protein HW401_771 [Parcubacteria group bacterium]|nr:hypothetical protein [Parcubacteria group bacterium]
MNKKHFSKITSIAVILLIIMVGIWYVTFKNILISEFDEQNRKDDAVIIPEDKTKTVIVQGTVKDWVSGKGVADAEVLLNEVLKKTTEDGSFSFASISTAGEVSISKIGYNSQKIFVTEFMKDTNSKEIFLIPNGYVTFLKQSKLFRANYDGSNTEVLTDDPIFLMARSPEGKYVAYTERTIDSNNEVVKIVDVSTKSVSEIARYPRFTSNTEIRIQKPQWSSNGAIVTWEVVKLREGKENSSLAYYDIKEKEIHYIKNPSTDYIEFDRIYNFAISPDSQFIAVLADSIMDESGDILRGIVLYDTFLERPLIVDFENKLYLPVLNEIFFDIDGNLHYGLVTRDVGPTPNSWVMYNTKTGKHNTFENKPLYWKTLRYGKFSFSGDKVAVSCPSVSGDICIAKNDGLQSQVIVSRDNLGISTIMDFFFSSNSRYILFSGNLKNNPDRVFLWIMSSDGGIFKQISEL